MKDTFSSLAWWFATIVFFALAESSAEAHNYGQVAVESAMILACTAISIANMVKR